MYFATQLSAADTRGKTVGHVRFVNMQELRGCLTPDNWKVLPSVGVTKRNPQDLQT